MRNTLACLIQFPNETLVWVVNTHLGCHTELEQYQQAMELSTFLQSLESIEKQKERRKMERDDEVNKVIIERFSTISWNRHSFFVTCVWNKFFETRNVFLRAFIHSC